MTPSTVLINLTPYATRITYRGHVLMAAEHCAEHTIYLADDCSPDDLAGPILLALAEGVPETGCRCFRCSSTWLWGKYPPGLLLKLRDGTELIRVAPTEESAPAPTPRGVRYTRSMFNAEVDRLFPMGLGSPPGLGLDLSRSLGSHLGSHTFEGDCLACGPVCACPELTPRLEPDQ